MIELKKKKNSGRDREKKLKEHNLLVGFRTMKKRHRKRERETKTEKQRDRETERERERDRA